MAKSGLEPKGNKFCNFCQTRKLDPSLMSWPSLTEFANPMLHVIYNLTRKIVRFYDSTRDFDNIGYEIFFFFTMV